MQFHAKCEHSGQKTNVDSCELAAVATLALKHFLFAEIDQTLQPISPAVCVQRNLKAGSKVRECAL
jgi:hypothetical protein